MSEDSPSKQLVLQRVRNRIIEYFEIASSFEEQRLYQTRLPYVFVQNEMIDNWEDWVDDERLMGYGPPVFTQSEKDSLIEFHVIWNNIAEELPDQLPPLEEIFKLPQWSRLREAAEKALNVLAVRGKLPEDHEVSIT